MYTYTALVILILLYNMNESIIRDMLWYISKQFCTLKLRNKINQLYHQKFYKKLHIIN